MATLAPRLPGIIFAPEQRRSGLDDVLPRMDVAAFVGFAASGPLCEPVAIEDALQFAATFGPDLPLAWDAERGEMVFAFLAPAVRAFFRNGGRRCWVVRVPRPTGDTGALGAEGLLVGFAERGPLDRPVRAESWNELAQSFGAERPGWLAGRHLPEAVALAEAGRAFFDGGGAACLALRLPDLADETIASSAGLFLDPELAELGVETLAARADYLRYQAPRPRPLLGIHALMAVEEVTLVAAPDCAQRGWLVGAPVGAPLPLPAAPATPALRCEPTLAPEEPGRFVPCAALAAPLLEPIEPPAPGAPLLIVWAAPEPAPRYELEEARSPDFADAALVYSGAEPRAELVGRSEGVSFYRVRAVSGDLRSPWSQGRGVQLGSRPRAALAPPVAPGTPRWLAMLDIQRAMLRMCAARGDTMAILGAPQGAGAADLRDHALALSLKPSGRGAALVLEDARGICPGGPPGLAPVESGRNRSFAALYHPWLVGRDEAASTTTTTPPDGAVCGIIARRTIERGAWIAPANEPLLGVVALGAPGQSARGGQPEAHRFAMQEAGVNLLAREPRGFVPASANTLAVVRCRPDDELGDQARNDPELRPINVRRLLSLLRRLALRLGMTYVFEPNSPAFRRQVQRGFEALLEALYLRGAFAGATAAGAFQVDVGPLVNTPAALEQGQLVVELRVAPARPLSFITVRLVRSGEQALRVQEP